MKHTVGSPGPPSSSNAGAHTQNPEKGTVSLCLEAPKATHPCGESLALHRLWHPGLGLHRGLNHARAAEQHCRWPTATEARTPEDSPNQQRGQLCGLGSHRATWTWGFPAPSEGLRSAGISETGCFSVSLLEFFSELLRKGREP